MTTTSTSLEFISAKQAQARALQSVLESMDEEKMLWFRDTLNKMNSEIISAAKYGRFDHTFTVVALSTPLEWKSGFYLKAIESVIKSHGFNIEKIGEDSEKRWDGERTYFITYKIFWN